jgi:uncharacterized protein
MNEFGLSEKTTNIIIEFFKKIPELKEVKIYGSRAKGNYKKGSDIDFAIFGDIDYRLTSKIAAELDELPTPYKFDVTDYNSLKHLPLKDHIDRVGKTFYKREI